MSAERQALRAVGLVSTQNMLIGPKSDMDQVASAILKVRALPSR